jgi:serine/threonine protein kinase
MENGNAVEFLMQYPETYCVHLVSLMRMNTFDTHNIDIFI